MSSLAIQRRAPMHHGLPKNISIPHRLTSFFLHSTKNCVEGYPPPSSVYVRHYYNTKGRALKRLDFAPSLMEIDTDYPQISTPKEIDNYLIAHHSQQRTVSFYIACMMMYFLRPMATAIKRDLGFDYCLSPNKALIQTGQAHQKSYHAAHNMIFNLRDNFALVLQTYYERKKPLPKEIKEILKIKGVPQVYLAEEPMNKLQFENITRHLFPIKLIETEGSLFSGSQFEEQILSTTVKVPADVNLICDKFLEQHTQNKMLMLLSKILVSDSSPEQASQEEFALCRAYFEKAGENIAESVEKIKIMQGHFQRLRALFAANIDPMTALSLMPVLHMALILYYQLSVSDQPVGVPHLHLPCILHKKVMTLYYLLIKERIKQAQNPLSTALMLSHFFKEDDLQHLIEEVAKRCQQREQLVEYHAAMVKGCVEPPYTFLIGFFDPIARKHIVNEDIKIEAARRLLSSNSRFQDAYMLQSA